MRKLHYVSMIYDNEMFYQSVFPSKEEALEDVVSLYDIPDYIQTKVNNTEDLVPVFGEAVHTYSGEIDWNIRSVGVYACDCPNSYSHIKFTVCE